MRIPITCPQCGKRYEVDGALAGKRGKCMACGARMAIPGKSEVIPSVLQEPDAYELDQANNHDAPSSFMPDHESQTFVEAQPRPVKRRKPGGSSKRRVERASSSLANSGRIALFVMACAVVVGLLVALFAPGSRANIGGAIAFAGLVVFGYGYASGAYIAFTEDDLYGWLYLIFPPYAAYYFVSRWDEMRSRLMMAIVGLAMLAGGGRLLEKASPKDVVVKDAVAAPS
jgi:hypothetical protein